MYPFSRSRARSIIASELSSKKTSFRAGAFSADFSRGSFFPRGGGRRCIPVEENKSYTPMPFSRLPDLFDYHSRENFARALLWWCLQLHLSCVFASSLTKLLPLARLNSNSLDSFEKSHGKYATKNKGRGENTERYSFSEFRLERYSFSKFKLLQIYSVSYVDINKFILLGLSIWSVEKLTKIIAIGRQSDKLDHV